MIDNIVIQGYFWTKPPCHVNPRERASYHGLDISLYGNSIFASIFANHSCFFLHNNISEILKGFIRERVTHQKLLGVTAEIVNVHSSIKITCSTSTIVQEILPEYHRNFNINEVEICQEGGPGHPIQLNELLKAEKQVQFHRLTLKTFLCTDEEGKDRSATIRFVRGKTSLKGEKVINITLIFPDCSRTSLEISLFFQAVKETLEEMSGKGRGKTRFASDYAKMIGSLTVFFSNCKKFYSDNEIDNIRESFSEHYQKAITAPTTDSHITRCENGKFMVFTSSIKTLHTQVIPYARTARAQLRTDGGPQNFWFWNGGNFRKQCRFILVQKVRKNENGQLECLWEIEEFAKPKPQTTAKDEVFSAAAAAAAAAAAVGESSKKSEEEEREQVEGEEKEKEEEQEAEEEEEEEEYSFSTSENEGSLSSSSSEEENEVEEDQVENKKIIQGLIQERVKKTMQKKRQLMHVDKMEEMKKAPFGVFCKNCGQQDVMNFVVNTGTVDNAWSNHEKNIRKLDSAIRGYLNMGNHITRCMKRLSWGEDTCNCCVLHCPPHLAKAFQVAGRPMKEAVKQKKLDKDARFYAVQSRGETEGRQASSKKRKAEKDGDADAEKKEKQYE